MQDHPNLIVHVARGPKPGLDPNAEAPNGNSALPEAVDLLGDSEEELVTRWAKFTAAMAKRTAAGWEWDEAAGVATNSATGATIAITPPPKPAGEAQGGTWTRANVGKAVPMPLAEFAATILGTATQANSTHPEQRHVMHCRWRQRLRACVWVGGGGGGQGVGDIICKVCL